LTHHNTLYYARVFHYTRVTLSPRPPIRSMFKVRFGISFPLTRLLLIYTKRW